MKQQSDKNRSVVGADLGYAGSIEVRISQNETGDVGRAH